MVRQLERGLVLVRVASGAPLVAGKASTGAADSGEALGFFSAVMAWSGSRVYGVETCTWVGVKVYL
jgi:hypothetical protein